MRAIWCFSCIHDLDFAILSLVKGCLILPFFLPAQKMQSGSCYFFPTLNGLRVLSIPCPILTLHPPTSPSRTATVSVGALCEVQVLFGHAVALFDLCFFLFGWVSAFPVHTMVHMNFAPPPTHRVSGISAEPDVWSRSRVNSFCDPGGIASSPRVTTSAGFSSCLLYPIAPELKRPVFLRPRSGIRLLSFCDTVCPFRLVPNPDHLMFDPFYTWGVLFFFFPPLSQICLLFQVLSVTFRR